MFFQLDGNAVSSQFFSLTNAPVTRQEAYSLTNVRVHNMTEDKKYELGLDVVSNLLNKHYAVMAFDISDMATGFGLTQSYPGRPRWATASLTYNF